MRLAPSRESATTPPGGAAPFSAPSDARTAYLAQKRELIRRRGAALVGGVAVPKTTTADVLELATWWSGEVDKLRAGGDLDDADRAAIATWRGCLDLISRRAETLDPAATYPDNAHAWGCVARIAHHLARRAVTPSWWQGARELAERGTRVVDHMLDQVDERIDRVGDRLAANAGKVGSEAGRSVGKAAVSTAVATAAVPVALAAGGIVAGIVLLRATSPAARTRRSAKRSAKATAKASPRAAKKGGRR